MKTFNWCIELAALIAALAIAAPARATPAEEEARFTQHYQRGLNLYSREEYEDAIREFQSAYAIRPRPRLLFNLGQAQRNLGNAKEALRFYLLYQAMEPNPKPGLKAELEGYIAQMRSNVQQAQAAQRAEEQTGAATTTPPTTTTLPPSLAPPPPAAGAAPRLTSSETHDAPPKPLHKRAWFWGVVGSVVVVAAVSIGLGVGLGANGGSSFHGDVRTISFGGP